MLKTKAEIKFTLEGKNYAGGKQFRPVFRFDDGLLFSGTIVSDESEYIYNKVYDVGLEFFTVKNEAYSALQPILKQNTGLTTQAGSKIIGIAALIDFAYEN